jgi:hypothetical protein
MIYDNFTIYLVYDGFGHYYLEETELRVLLQRLDRIAQT